MLSVIWDGKSAGAAVVASAATDRHDCLCQGLCIVQQSASGSGCGRNCNYGSRLWDGFDFLRQLQEYLNTIPYIKNEDILPISVYRPELVEEDDPKREKQVRDRAQKRRQKKAKELRAQKKRKNRDYHGAYLVSTFFAVVFALVIAGMFAITYLSDDNVNILNYENAIIDKYEDWQKALDKREKQLDERESELDEREDQLQLQEEN